MRPARRLKVVTWAGSLMEGKEMCSIVTVRNNWQ